LSGMPLGLNDSIGICPNSESNFTLKALAELAGLHVICPQGGSLSEPEIVEMIDVHTTLHEHILYVEPDASVNYLNMVSLLAQKTDYVVVYRNLEPTDPSMQLLSLGRDRS
jgi:hypothetical protein